MLILSTAWYAGTTSTVTAYTSGSLSLQVCAVMCKYNDELSIHQTQIELNAQGMNFTMRTSPVMGGAEAEQVHRPCLSGQASKYKVIEL